MEHATRDTRAKTGATKTASTNASKTASNASKTQTNVLDGLTFFAKTRGGGGSNYNPNRACYDKKQHRFTLSAYYYANGFRSGRLALDKNTNSVYLQLDKNRYTGTFMALHATQNFITCGRANPCHDVLATSHYWSLELVDDKNNLYKLAPSA